MKKIPAILLILALFVTSVFANNYQKIYSIDDPIFEDISTLYLLEGRSLPSTSGPWSGQELLDMMNKLNLNTLKGTAKEIADSVMAKLEEDSKGKPFELSFRFSTEVNLHSNTETTFQGRDNWVRDFNKSLPFATIVDENHIGKNFYGICELSLGPSMHYYTKNGAKDFGSTVFSSNIPLVGTNTNKTFSSNMPLKAFLSAGGNCWSFQIGRDRLSWGNGKVGNLILGDQVQYHDMIRFNAWSDRFKYTYVFSDFPHPSCYYNDEGVKVYGVNGQGVVENGISAFIAHRLEWNITKNLNLAMTEGIMYMNENNKLSISTFMPSMFYHNLYTGKTSNSIAGLEFDWTPLKGLNIYGQGVVDQFAIMGESDPKKPGTNGEPNAFGFLGGATYITNTKNGILSFNAEGAYTDPYLYLRAVDINKTEDYKYGLNFVVAVREVINAGTQFYYDEQFLGYRFGCDAVTLNFNSEYRQANWKAGFNAFLMMHGTHDQWTKWTRVSNDTMENVQAPTSTHQTGNYNDETAQTTRNEVETTAVIGLYGSYDFKFDLSLFSQLDYVLIYNKGNIKGPVKQDLQFTVGATYSLNMNKLFNR